jgi:hypothetical protein
MFLFPRLLTFAAYIMDEKIKKTVKPRCKYNFPYGKESRISMAEQ